MNKEFKFIKNHKEKHVFYTGNKKHVMITDHIGCMCPKCFSVKEMDIVFSDVISPVYEDEFKDSYVSNEIYGKCPKCGKHVKFIQLDINIAEIVGILNRKGYYTAYCCEGHLEENNDGIMEFNSPYIYFYYWSDTEILETYPLPNTWHIQPDDKECRIFSIRDTICDNTPKSIEDYDDYIELVESSWDQEKSLSDIYEWALSLPTKDKNEKSVHRSLIRSVGKGMINANADIYIRYLNSKNKNKIGE